MVCRLEELCRIQIAIEIANKLEFKSEILRLPSLDLYRSFWYNGNEPWFENMEKKVLDSLKKLPFGLREKIPIPVAIFCLSQSIEWAKFHNEEFDLPFDYSCSFLRSSFFTSKGILDEEKAAREIIKDIELSPSLKFCIACYYCLSDVIPVLWEQLPEHKIDNGFRTRGRNEMADMWSYSLLGELEIIMEEEDDSFSLYKFKKTFDDVSSRNCNDVAFKKCFEELNESEKEKALIFARDILYYFLSNMETFGYRESDTTPYLFPLQLFLPFQKYLEIAIFFLRHLDERQLMVFFEPLTLHYVLFHLLSLPYQHMFMDVVSQFWEVLPKTGFCLLLHRIVSLIKNKSSSKLCDYHNILRDFWNQSSASLKKFFFRLEGINKRDMLNVNSFTHKEMHDYFISYLHSDFKHLDCMFSYVICELFESPFTIEDEKILRLIFSSATLEEKSDIERLQGNRIGKISFDECELRRIDLFIECCLPKERIESFKKELFNDEDVKKALFYSVFYSVGEEFQKILNWAFSAEEEIKECLKNFLLYVRQEFKYSLCTCKEVKYIDKNLEWALSSNEIENFKKSLVLDVGSFARHFKYCLLSEDFQDIDFFLEWIFSSEIKILKFKKDFAFEMVHLMDKIFLRNGLILLKKFTEWSALSEEEGKDFRRQVALSEEVIEYYSKLVAQRQLNEVDEFIQWAELTETEVKNFIKLVDKNNNILKVRPKRELGSSLKSNSAETKRSRHC
ncbi:UNVERIFIED_CONTAM: hypothetical protein RMT77_018021 [Armadillidium vulgare]